MASKYDVMRVASVVALVFISIAGLAVVGTIVRSQMEPLSWAEGRCDHLVPPGAADSEARWDCLRTELAEAKRPVAAASRELAIFAAVTALAAASALVGRRPARAVARMGKRAEGPRR